MNKPPQSFKEWHARHLHELTRDYRQYLRDILGDERFDITNVEDFYTWSRPEYEVGQGAQELSAASCMYQHDHIAHPEQCEWHD